MMFGTSLNKINPSKTPNIENKIEENCSKLSNNYSTVSNLSLDYKVDQLLYDFQER